MSSGGTKAVARRFIEQVWNAVDLDAVDGLVHPEYPVPGVGRGPEGVGRDVATFRAAFPDLEWAIEDMFAEGDRVAVRVTLRGTQRGEFRGIVPTDKRVTLQEMVFWRVVDGRLRAGWFQADALGLRVQLGSLPPD